MLTATNTTVFNPVQMQLLTVFNNESSEERLNEIKVLLMNYYQEKLDSHLNSLWDSGVLDQNRLDEIAKMDLHKC